MPVLADGNPHNISLGVASAESDHAINQNWFVSGLVQVRILGVRPFLLPPSSQRPSHALLHNSWPGCNGPQREAHDWQHHEVHCPAVRNDEHDGQCRCERRCERYRLSHPIGAHRVEDCVRLWACEQCCVHPELGVHKRTELSGQHTHTGMYCAVAGMLMSRRFRSDDTDMILCRMSSRKPVALCCRRTTVSPPWWITSNSPSSSISQSLSPTVHNVRVPPSMSLTMKANQPCN